MQNTKYVYAKHQVFRCSINLLRSASYTLIQFDATEEEKRAM